MDFIYIKLNKYIIYMYIIILFYFIKINQTFNFFLKKEKSYTKVFNLSFIIFIKFFKNYYVLKIVK